MCAEGARGLPLARSAEEADAADGGLGTLDGGGGEEPMQGVAGGLRWPQNSRARLGLGLELGLKGRVVGGKVKVEENQGGQAGCQELGTVLAGLKPQVGEPWGWLMFRDRVKTRLGLREDKGGELGTGGPRWSPLPWRANLGMDER